MIHEISGEIEYRLRVHPHSPNRPWHATLEHPNPEHSDDTQRLEFNSPLELVAHLERLSKTQSKRGLR